MTTKRSLTFAFRLLLLLTAVALAAAAGARTARPSTTTLPPGNTVEQWDQIAEDTVVGSGAFQNEGFLYMAYESTAVYDAAVSIAAGGYKPLLPKFRVWRNASPDAAVVEAAYRTLSTTSRRPRRRSIPARGGAGGDPGRAGEAAGQRIGQVAADQVIRERTGDGLMTPIGSTSTFPTLTPGPACGG